MTFSIPDTLAQLADRKLEAAGGKLSRSGYVRELIERDLTASGDLSAVEDRSEEILAGAKRVGPDRVMKAIVQLERRQKRRA